jgi:endonuclease/exonuclease/phosphatase (EEP) superfamily protein YafD
MSINGLFWNVAGVDRMELVADIAAERELDVVVLAEPSAGTDSRLGILASRTGHSYHIPLSETGRLLLLTRSAELGFEEVYCNANGRLTVRSMTIDGVEFLFAAAHLVSKLNWAEPSQQFEVLVLADEIRNIEQIQGHRRTILVGDLNLNPFEHGVVAAKGLHAMMAKADVAVGSRIVQDIEYPFFYNPMWGLFGDRTPGPPGSHYYRAGEQVTYDWNLFDQLLLRPDALSLIEENVELLTQIGGVNLATDRGRPNAGVGSDHFPLYFRFTSVSRF